MSFTASRLGSCPLGAAPPQHRSGLSAAAARRRPATGTRLLVRALANTFGTAFRVTTFGESHGGGVGCVVDGVPPRMRLSTPELQARGALTSVAVTQPDAAAGLLRANWRTPRNEPPDVATSPPSVRAGPPASGAEPHHDAPERRGHVRDPVGCVVGQLGGAHEVCALTSRPPHAQA